MIDTSLMCRPDVAYFILAQWVPDAKIKRCVKWDIYKSETIDSECKYVFIKECCNQLVMSVLAGH